MRGRWVFLRFIFKLLLVAMVVFSVVFVVNILIDNWFYSISYPFLVLLNVSLFGLDGSCRMGLCRAVYDRLSKFGGVCEV